MLQKIYYNLISYKIQEKTRTLNVDHNVKWKKNNMKEKVLESPGEKRNGAAKH